MRIAHIILPGASEYERKCQRIDREALAEEHEVVVTDLEQVRTDGAHVAHIYASGDLPARAFVNFPIPYVASTDLPATRWSFRRPPAPARVVSPVSNEGERHQLITEAVETRYFDSARHTGSGSDEKIIGSFARPSVRNAIEQTLARIYRFREDVSWELFEQRPTPEDLARLDAWIDPAVTENDFDGFVAEALVIGMPVIATRTQMNVQRLEKGRTGVLVPPRDPNEMTHAILAALFKPEVAEKRQAAARQTISKFRPRQRARLLTRMYDDLLS